MFQKDEFLTQDKRKKFNSLVDTVNQKIVSSLEISYVKRRGGQVR